MANTIRQTTTGHISLIRDLRLRWSAQRWALGGPTGERSLVRSQSPPQHAPDDLQFPTATFDVSSHTRPWTGDNDADVRGRRVAGRRLGVEARVRSWVRSMPRPQPGRGTITHYTSSVDQLLDHARGQGHDPTDPRGHRVVPGHVGPRAQARNRVVPVPRPAAVHQVARRGRGASRRPASPATESRFHAPPQAFLDRRRRLELRRHVSLPLIETSLPSAKSWSGRVR